MDPLLLITLHLLATVTFSIICVSSLVGFPLPFIFYLPSAEIVFGEGFRTKHRKDGKIGINLLFAGCGHIEWRFDVFCRQSVFNFNLFLFDVGGLIKINRAIEFGRFTLDRIVMEDSEYRRFFCLLVSV